MSQDAYALFQTIKKIKGYIMIRTSTYATPKYALSDTYLVSLTTNIASTNLIGTFTPTISNSIPSTANHAIVGLNGSNHVRLTAWIASLITGHGIRIVGWSKTKDSKYVPSLLYQGVFGTVSTSTSSILGNDLVPVITFTAPTFGFPLTAADSNQMYHQFAGYTTIPGSLFLNTMGYTHLDFEFISTTATANACNVYVTEV